MNVHVLDPISNLPIGPEVLARAAARPERIKIAGRFVRLEPLDPDSHGPSLWHETHGSGVAARWQYLFDEPFADARSFHDFLTLKAASADPLFYAIVDQPSGRAVGFETLMRIDPVLGTDLPTSMGEAVAVSSRLFLKVGPDQFWIITRDNEDLARALESVVSPTVGSVTSLSHSRTCIWIDGPSSREVLATGIALDLDPAVFPPNSFALTGLHHTPILVLRSDATRFELYVSRTFAVWTWEWLTDAALPYGYEVDVPD